MSSVFIFLFVFHESLFLLFIITRSFVCAKTVLFDYNDLIKDVQRFIDSLIEYCEFD